MNNQDNVTRLYQAIRTHQAAILEEWSKHLKQHASRFDSAADEITRRWCSQFLSLFAEALHSGRTESIDGSEWDDVRHLLGEMSQVRARQGSTPSETATFVFSLKQPFFTHLNLDLGGEHDLLLECIWTTTALIDKLGLFTIEIFQKARDQIIVRQQQELLELSTPVVKLWHDVLALPLIGTLDSARTQVVMENLLQKIVETGASIAIIDITGVPTVDTLVAQHLLKTIAAARLMGADCIISGIRPQIAQTIVHLGVNLEDVVTKATLADAFMVALERTGSTVTHSKPHRS